MRQERMKDIDGVAIAFDADKVVTVRPVQSTHSHITFLGGGGVTVEGSFATIADRIWPPEPFPI